MGLVRVWVQRKDGSGMNPKGSHPMLKGTVTGGLPDKGNPRKRAEQAHPGGSPVVVIWEVAGDLAVVSINQVLCCKQENWKS